jgi:2-phospho-L-lactate guanylyltransferase
VPADWTVSTDRTVSTEWTVVIPVKGTADAKSRLGASADLAMAIALDSVEAALGAARVVVVTTPDAAPLFSALGASVVDDRGGGLNAAIAAGVAAAGEGAVAVLLGDVPALSGRELAATLELAARHPLAMVADADDVGTVLITALHASSHAPAFGPGSRVAHAAAGYVELSVPAASGLRRDVDTLEHLLALDPDALGARTRALLAAGQS